LNWGTRFVGCEKKKKNPERRTCVAGIIERVPAFLARTKN
jgi:hypothetical protein